MTTASHASPTNVQGAALLATAGVLSTLEGARSAVPVIKACLQAAAARWPDAQIGAWLPAIDRLMAELRKAAVNDDAMAVRMSQDPPNDCSLLQEVLKWDPPVTRAGVEIDLSALLGRSLAVHAERGTTLPQDLISGALTLRRANRAKGRRAPSDCPKHVYEFRSPSLSNIRKRGTNFGHEQQYLTRPEDNHA